MQSSPKSENCYHLLTLMCFKPVRLSLFLLWNTDRCVSVFYFYLLRFVTTQGVNKWWLIRNLGIAMLANYYMHISMHVFIMEAIACWWILLIDDWFQCVSCSSPHPNILRPALTPLPPAWISCLPVHESSVLSSWWIIQLASYSFFLLISLCEDPRTAGGQQRHRRDADDSGISATEDQTLERVHHSIPFQHATQQHLCQLWEFHQRSGGHLVGGNGSRKCGSESRMPSEWRWGSSFHLLWEGSVV